MEVIVTSEQGVDISTIETGLRDGTLLGRPIIITDSMPLSDRNLKADIELSEMMTLRARPDILQVERIEEMDQRLILRHGATQVINPQITWAVNPIHDNWALSFCAEPGSQYRYSHAGEGVDVVIMDSGITVGHTEFDDQFGNSRIQQIEWKPNQNIDKPLHYTDTDGHGTHVAGTVAGKTQGWARASRIYAIKIFDTDSYNPIEALQLVRAWHNAKSGPDAGRPTVLNNSWGYSAVYPENYPYDKDGNLAVGSPLPLAGSPHPVRVASVEAEIQSLVAAGVIVVSASGNEDLYVATPADPAYNDRYMTDSSFNWVPEGDPSVVYAYYHKRGSPGESSTFNVGSHGDFGVGSATEISYFSNYGTGVNIFAPGIAIQSAKNDISSPDLLTKLQGTSMASPQVAGIAAVYLSQNPSATGTDIANYFNRFGIHDAVTDIEYPDIGGATNLIPRSTFNGMKVKHAGEWKLIQSPAIKDAGEWKQPKKVYVKNQGQWVKIYG